MRVNDIYLGGWLYSVFASHFRVEKSVVFVTHEVFERRAAIRKCMRLLNITKECLFRVSVQGQKTMINA
jgi:hypothetical protein